MSSKRVAVAVALLFGLSSLVASAQQSAGSISGNAATGDVVDIKGADTGFHRELKIEKDGKYQLRAVPPGSYIVTVTHADGTTTESFLEVRAGAGARVK